MGSGSPGGLVEVRGVYPGYLVSYSPQVKEGYSSYNYQKFFRALYGYTQVVQKAGGRTYVYFRPGVLYSWPYIKKWKNEVIIPKEALRDVLEFFKTGKNPAHQWERPVKVKYSIEDVSVPTEEVKRAVVEAIRRQYIRVDSKNVPLLDVVDSVPREDLYSVLKNIVNCSWYDAARGDPLITKISRRLFG